MVTEGDRAVRCGGPGLREIRIYIDKCFKESVLTLDESLLVLSFVGLELILRNNDTD